MLQQQSGLLPRNTWSRKRWAAHVREAWRSTVESIFETGRRLIAAKADLAHGEWIALIERDLPFKRTTAFRLIAIAEDARLLDGAHGQHLPASWRTLYELTKLPDEVLDAKFADGTINPEIERPDVQLMLNRISRQKKFDKLIAAALPTTDKVPVLYMDPPWQFKVWRESSAYGAALEHYPVMTLDELCALPIPACASDDAVLFMWTTAPMLREAFRVLDAWGFDFKTEMAWDKEVQGMGYWVRNQHEPLLIASRGDMPPPDPANKPVSVIRSRRGKHSEKPVEMYENIERMYPDLPKREFFARNWREGWREPWGNQLPAVPS